MVLSNVALTGASGMVGLHVLAILGLRGILCKATSRTRPVLMTDSITWKQWDLTEYKTLEELDKLFPNVDALLHVGADVPNPSTQICEKDLFDANVRACLCLGRWALERGIHMVFLSGATVYAESEKNGIREDAKKTYKGLGGFYGFTKLLAEEVLFHLQENGLKLTILRPSSIYGYRMHKSKMIMRFLCRAEQDYFIELYPPVDVKIDLIHAYDVANAMVQVVENNLYGRIFNIASESPSSILEIAQTCTTIVRKGKVKVLSKEDNQGNPSIRFGLNCDAARSAFAFSPKINLERGVEMVWKKMMLPKIINENQ